MLSRLAVIGVATILACGGTKRPAPTGGGAATWQDRMTRVFAAFKDSLVPGDATRIAAAGWRVLGEPPPSDHPGAQLAERVSSQISKRTLEPARAWQVIDAMANAVDDPHTLLIAPATMELFQASLQGKPFTAPGITVAYSGRDLIVTEVFSDSPAKTAGLAVGDVIISINGAPPSRSWSVRGATFLPTETAVTLAIRRDGSPRELSYRASLYAHPVSAHRVLDGVGILHPYFFPTAEDPARNAVALARVALADFDRSKVASLVIDLRGNQGGEGVAAYVSLFTDADPILIAWRRWEERATDKDPPTPFANTHTLHPTRRPLAVLIDEQTVSAGEMVALALREHAGARVFGQPTGAALNVPNPIELGDGHFLLLPDVPVYTPRGIDSPPLTRVEPDVAIPNRTVEDLRANRDPQLDAATHWLAEQR